MCKDLIPRYRRGRERGTDGDRDKGGEGREILLEAMFLQNHKFREFSKKVYKISIRSCFVLRIFKICHHLKFQFHFHGNLIHLSWSDFIFPSPQTPASEASTEACSRGSNTVSSYLYFFLNINSFQDRSEFFLLKFLTSATQTKFYTLRHLIAFIFIFSYYSICAVWVKKTILLSMLQRTTPWAVRIVLPMAYLRTNF